MDELKDLLKEIGRQKFRLKVINFQKFIFFHLKKPRKFNFSTFKNIKNKEYIKKISF